MELLIGIVVFLWITKTAISDVAYAIRGHVPPRITHRINGRRVKSTRYGLSDYLTDLWHDGWEHARQKQQARGAAKLAPVPAEPVGASHPPVRAAKVTAPPVVVMPEPIAGDPPSIVDHWGDLSGEPHTRILPERQQPQPIRPYDVDAMDDYIDTDIPQTITAKENPMALATGEAVNVETALVQVDAMSEDLNVISDLLEQLDKERGDIEGVATTLTEHLTAYDLDGEAIAAVGSVQELLGRSQLHEMFAAIEAAHAQLNGVRDHIIATYGDAAETVAATGVNPQFLAS